MKKFIYAIVLTAVAGVFVSAQTSGDFRKTEFYAGYSYGQIQDRAEDASWESYHGFEVAGVYNATRYVGIKGDVSGSYRNNRSSLPAPFASISFVNNSSVHNFLGGVQLKDNASGKRFKPFVHGLVGVGVQKFEVYFDCSPTSGAAGCGVPSKSSETGLAGAFGGGLDVKINDRFDFRAFQVDYNPIKFEGGTDHNVRFGIGIVIK